MSSILKIQNVSLTYSSKNSVKSLPINAISDVNLNLNYGEIGCILGPSGCGKTSLLRIIAGFLEPQQGKITIGEKVVYDASNTIKMLSPDKRKIGMVFQDYALFPHLNVENNILFALTKGLPSRATNIEKTKCDEMLEITGMSKNRKNFIHQLSGGQQQRVALARALAPAPDLLLLDEPFSSLDPNLRSNLCQEVLNILKITKTTALVVTHDQQEAFSIAEKIGVIFSGSLVQWCSPYDLYHKPKTAEIAKFIGEGAFITGVKSKSSILTSLGSFCLKDCVREITTKSEIVRVLLRPDDIIHDDASSLEAKVLKKDFRGADFLYTLELANGEKVLSLVPSHHDHPINKPIGIKLEVDHVVTFSAEEVAETFTNSG